MYKEWMLIFTWEVNGMLTKERFFFEKKENMIKFVKENKDTVKFEAAFKLEKLNNEIFT